MAGKTSSPLSRSEIAELPGCAYRSRVVSMRLREVLENKGKSLDDIASEESLPRAMVDVLIEHPDIVTPVLTTAHIGIQMGIFDEASSLFNHTDITTAPPLRCLLDGSPSTATPVSCTSPQSAPAVTEESMVRVCVVGGGNLGHVLVGHLGCRDDVHVRWLLSSEAREREISSSLRHNRHDGRICVTFNSDGGGGGARSPRKEYGRPDVVTSDAGVALADVDVIINTQPTFLLRSLLLKIGPYMKRRGDIILYHVPAWGGYHWIVDEVLCTRFGIVSPNVVGIASIPWMCTTRVVCSDVTVLGTKEFNSIVPYSRVRMRDGGDGGARVSDVFAHISGGTMLPLGSSFALTIWPGNQIMHTAIMYDLFVDRTLAARGSSTATAAVSALVLKEQPLFYEGLSERGGEILETMGQELYELKLAIDASTSKEVVDLRDVLPLSLAIQMSHGRTNVDDGFSMSLGEMIAGNVAYRGIKVPMTKTRTGEFTLNLTHRVFADDVPFGLVTLKGIAQILGVRLPTIDRVLAWCQERMGRVYIVEKKESLGDGGGGAGGGGVVTEWVLADVGTSDVRYSSAPQVFGVHTKAQLLARPSVDRVGPAHARL